MSSNWPVNVNLDGVHRRNYFSGHRREAESQPGLGSGTTFDRSVRKRVGRIAATIGKRTRSCRARGRSRPHP